MKNISSIPAFKKLETLDGEQLMINFSDSLKNINDETPCIYASGGKVERRVCNFSSPKVVVCTVTTAVEGND